VIELNDPLEGLYYVLEPQKQIAHRVKYTPAQRPRFDTPVSRPAPKQPVAGELITPGGPGPQMNREELVEPLGTQQLEGVEARGRRSTVTYPAGTLASDQPVKRTTESWISDSLRLSLLTRTADPRSGEMIVKLTNLKQSEPDAALFQPPPDYRIVDEVAAFSIEYSR
jgi:hypothetical protein